MNASDFSAKFPGKLTKTLEGEWAFVPEPLPPQLDFSLETLASLSEADQFLGQLAGVGQTLPNPHLLIGPFLRREAVLSSRIEGTEATAEELLLFEVAPNEAPRTPDVREVANYVHALNHGLSRLSELPVSLRLIREVHSVLMKNVRGEEKKPGEFRTRQNYIARPGQPLAEARFVPPPVAEMNQAMNDLEKYLHRRELPTLIDLALIHYQFEAIHPFMDGNGRVGRLLISLLLCERGQMSQPLLYLSAYFERNRRAYYDLLLSVSHRGAWADWVMFFLRGIAEQSRDAIQRARKLVELREGYRGWMQEPGIPAPILLLVDALFENPAITIPRAKALLNVKTFHTARSYIEKLCEAGILKEHTGRRRNRIYVAPEILAVIESDTP
jgi:Fic family protein